MAVDVKQLELTRLTEQLASVQHQLALTQQVTFTLLINRYYSMRCELSKRHYTLVRIFAIY